MYICTYMYNQKLNYRLMFDCTYIYIQEKYILINYLISFIITFPTIFIEDNQTYLAYIYLQSKMNLL